jgi:hypothetical protein
VKVSIAFERASHVNSGTSQPFRILVAQAWTRGGGETIFGASSEGANFGRADSNEGRGKRDETGEGG